MSFPKHFLSCCITALLFNLGANSEIIIVTSNANSGAGTLREALAKAEANGFTERDEIHFNLAGSNESDRTITLLSELPHVRSNTIIDATTQPGPAFGRSDAKIAIRPDRSIYANPQYFTGAFFLDEARNAELYGFYIYDFYDLKNRFPSSGSLIDAAVYVGSSSDVIIGAPGKGNVLVYNEYGIYVNGDVTIQRKSERIKVQSNWVGLNPDGTVRPEGGFNPIGISVYGGNSTIGGDTPGMGNIVSGYYSVGVSFKGENFVIQYNKFGVDVDGIADSRNVRIETYGSNLPSNNLIADNLANSLFLELRYLRNFTVVRNRSIKNSSGFPAIQLFYCEDATFGTDRDEDLNTFIGIKISALFCKRIQVRKNSISCTASAYSTDDATVPNIQVLVSNDSEYSGVATPNSEIYIYNDNTNCEFCNPVELYAKVIADATGSWKINGDFSAKKLVANATILEASSEYASPTIMYNNADITYTHPSCDRNNGTIKMVGLKHVLKVEWFNISDQKVAEGVEARNLGPGRYYAKCYNGNCFVKSRSIDLMRVKPSISDLGIKIKQPTCGLKNGSITDLGYSLAGLVSTQLKWVDKSGNVIQDRVSNIYNLGAGEYTFIVSIPGDCEVAYGPVILNESNGPSIDISHVTVSPTPCNKSEGSVRGIRFSGTAPIQYKWKNAKLETVSTGPDLIDAPAGVYTLEVQDQSSCGIVKTDPIEIMEENSVLIGEDVIILPSSCSVNTGSITGISISGATKYEWYSENGGIVASTKDLLNASAGRYRLLASNSTCFDESPYYTIPQLPSTVFPDYPAIVRNAACSLDDGMISIDLGNGLKPSKIRWVNSNGVNIGDAEKIENLVAGEYKLFFEDNSGCEVFYRTYVIQYFEPLTFDLTQLHIKGDECLNGVGEISGISVTGGMGPYVYVWTDPTLNNEIIGRAPVIGSLKAGVYKLNIKSSLTEACQEVSQSFTVPNIAAALSAPRLSDLSICAPGEAVIKVNSAESGTYRIYDSEQSVEASDENASGVFTVRASNNTVYYVSFSNGSCESERTPVSITVASNEIKIPNTISPNGDGINDFWELKGIESYSSSVDVSIFNRYGQRVYYSRGYQKPFTGNVEGSQLSTGTYYYIINLRAGCNPISGSLTLMR